MFIVEPLSPAHERRRFDCGEESLNRYFRERAGQDLERRLNRIFIIRQDEQSLPLGYYTLAATAIETDRLPSAHAKRLPRYPIPAALLGKFAVAVEWQGRGLGRLLLGNAVRRVQAAATQLGIHVMVVDPLNEGLADFYASAGFTRFPPEQRQFLFMDSLDKTDFSKPPRSV